jgi:hypothetical protein
MFPPSCKDLRSGVLIPTVNQRIQLQIGGEIGRAQGTVQRSTSRRIKCITAMLPAEETFVLSKKSKAGAVPRSGFRLLSIEFLFS